VSSPRAQGSSGLWVGTSEVWARPTGSSIGTHRQFPSALGGFYMHFSNERAKVPRVEQPSQAQTQGLVPGHDSSWCCGRNREKIGPWSVYSRCSLHQGRCLWKRNEPRSPGSQCNVNLRRSLSLPCPQSLLTQKGKPTIVWEHRGLTTPRGWRPEALAF
jgi:hypothetical protein